MAASRRDFIKATAAAGAVSLLLPNSARSNSEAPGTGPLDLLILGGTGFIGPHMVREALRRGHSVTLFNRGQTNNELFPDLETIKGDRAGDLAGLAGRRWHGVVDNSGYMPQHVQASTRLLSENIEHYIFISSISAYASFAEPMTESSPLAQLEDENVSEFDWSLYGGLKALSERRASEEIGDDRLAVLRPTFICGPGDHTDRFTYWPVRTASGGQMLWAGGPTHPIQIVDVRDLANFVVDALELKTAGIYNMVNPADSYTMGQLLEDSQAVSATSVDPVWVDDAFIEEQEAFGALPIYHPVSGEYAHTSSVSGARARAAGLRNRPVRETIRDLMSWWSTLPAERIENARFRMTAEREAELIAVWQGREQD